MEQKLDITGFPSFLVPGEIEEPDTTKNLPKRYCGAH